MQQTAASSQGLTGLRWGSDRGPPQRCAQPRPHLQHWLRQRRRRQRDSDLACRTIEHGRGSSGSGGGLQGSSLLAFQPSSSQGGGGGAAEVDSSGTGLPPLTPIAASGAPRSSLAPKETFQQLRKAVLTSLDFADSVEHTVDYEDGGGGAEVQEDIPLETGPSAKEVGKSVFEVRRRVLLCICMCRVMGRRLEVLNRGRGTRGGGRGALQRCTRHALHAMVVGLPTRALPTVIRWPPLHPARCRPCA